MDIKNLLLEEHSKKQSNIITQGVLKNHNLMKDLMDCFFDDHYRLSQRAAWSVSMVAEKKPELLQPYLQKMVEGLYREDVHDAIIRNTLRVFSFVEIPEELEGELYDRCMYFLGHLKIANAIRVFSMSASSRIAIKYPELREELIQVITMYNTPDATPAYKSRAKKVLKYLNQ